MTATDAAGLWGLEFYISPMCPLHQESELDWSCIVMATNHCMLRCRHLLAKELVSRINGHCCGHDHRGGSLLGTLPPEGP